jgi:hypothetical protein
MKALNYLMAATGLASAIALFDLPYDYYTMLRGLVSVSAVFLGIFAVLRGQFVWLVLAVPAFLLWFPLFGVSMDKGSWAPWNLLAAAGFLLAWAKFSFNASSGRSTAGKE